MPRAKRQPARLRELAERLAVTLANGGMQRSTARVLTALLFTPEATMTAGDLATELQISSGSVSGALKQLTTATLIEQVPAPGSRRGHFSIRPDAWATLMSRQNAFLLTMQQAAEEGVAVAGERTVAGRRLAEMRDFYTLMADELPALIDHWHEQQG